MLYADKVALANRARLRMLQIRERELELYTRNSRSLGFQNAVLAVSGFAALVYCKMSYYQEGGFWMQLLYPFMISLLVGSTLLSLHNFTLIAMLGPGLALRGPDGSVHIAIESIMVEYRTAVFFFGCGIVSFHLMVLTYAWSQRHPQLLTNLGITFLMLTSLYLILTHAHYVATKFKIDEVHTGAFYPSQAVYTLDDGINSGRNPSPRRSRQQSAHASRRSRQLQ